MPDMPAAFLADILDRPEDDTPRLIYADWLEENDRQDRAEFIRWQIAGEPDNWRGHRDALPFPSIDWPDSLAGLTDCGERLECLDKGFLQWQWQRGFLDSVGCNADAWLSHGPALAAHHPISKVVLTDKRPLTVARSPLAFWESSFSPGLAAPDQLAEVCWLMADRRYPEACLPAALWTYLVDHTGWQILTSWVFHDTAEALAGLSQLCLAWARSKRDEQSP